MLSKADTATILMGVYYSILWTVERRGKLQAHEPNSIYMHGAVCMPRVCAGGSTGRMLPMRPQSNALSAGPSHKRGAKTRGRRGSPRCSHTWCAVRQGDSRTVGAGRLGTVSRLRATAGGGGAEEQKSRLAHALQQMRAAAEAAQTTRIPQVV